jgi:hypothetical protein
VSGTDLTGALREEVGRLTAGPLTDFVASRTARARELKAAGRVDLARELTGCRKPTVPAWGADQLAHHHPDELDALFAAADRVRGTQVADPDRDAVRAASAGFTAQVRRLRALTGERLAAAGTSPEAHLDEVEATLLAAATDDTVAADLRAGALLRPAPSPGFTALASLAAPAGRGRPRAPRPDGGATPTAPTDQAASEARRAAELETILTRRADAAERLADAEAAVRRAADETAAARHRSARLQAEIERLQRDAGTAEEQVAAGEEAERAARQAADDLAEQVAALDRQAEQVAPSTG